jgi:hypothetical protein
LSLCLTKQHAMKAYWGNGCIAPRILDLGTGAEWSPSRPGRFTPRERAPGTHWMEGWVSPRAVLVAVVKRKIPNPRWESNPRTPIIQPVAQRYTDWTITALPTTTMMMMMIVQGVRKSLETNTQTSIDVVFSGPDDDRDGHRNVGTIRTPNAADSPRRLHQIHSPRKHQDL